MADVNIYVALISAVAGASGAAISQLTTVYREGRQAKLDRLERRAEKNYQACLELLRAAGNLRTQLANNNIYHGAEMGARLELVRQHAAATQLAADTISLLIPANFAKTAELIAEDAGNLADWAVANTDLNQGSMLRKPDFHELDHHVKTFRAEISDNSNI
jgi:hypothetical protein